MTIVEFPTSKIKERRSGKRSNEIARGFDHYHRIACKLAQKQFGSWFPTREDLVQAAALAATEAVAMLGEEATLKQLCRALRPVLYEQAVAYGLRSTTDRKAGTHKQIRRELCLCQVVLEENELYQLEYHRGAIGVGQFTLMAARELHRVVNLVEPEEAGLAQVRKAEMRRRMYQALESDPELCKLRDWYLSRSCYFGYKAMEQEGLCGRNKGHQLIIKARRLAGVECKQYEVEMAQKVAALYQASSDKRHKELGKQLKMGKTSVRKWLELARHLGILPIEIEKSTRQRVLEAIQTYPELSYTQIGKQLGISKTTVLFWKNVLRSENLLA